MKFYLCKTIRHHKNRKLTNKLRDLRFQLVITYSDYHVLPKLVGKILHPSLKETFFLPAHGPFKVKRRELDVKSTEGCTNGTISHTTVHLLFECSLMWTMLADYVQGGYGSHLIEI